MPDAALLDAERLIRWRPPSAPRSSLEFARSMLLPDGKAKGEHWDPATEPVQITLVRESDNPQWQVIVHPAPSQRGKSLLGVALPLLRSIVEMRQNVAYVMPNLEKLEQAWHGKLFPMFEGCGYGALMPKMGPGSAGGKPSILVLRDPRTNMRLGSVSFMAAGGGGKETSLAAITAPVVLMDEADDLENEAQVGLAFRRVKAFGEDFRVFIVSTLNDRRHRDAHPILIFYERGTRSRLWYACPHCKRYQPLESDRMQWEMAEGGYSCAHCPAVWTEADRHRALNVFLLVHHGQTVDEHGTVIGPGPTGRWFSLLAWDLEYHQASMTQITAEYRAARTAIEDRADHGPMRQFFYKVLCRDYTGDVEEIEHGQELTWQGLHRRSVACSWGPVRYVTDKAERDMGFTFSRHIADIPADCAFTVAGVDVQGNRVYTVLVGATTEGTTYDVAWSYEMARIDHAPWNRQELHALLDRVDVLLHRWSAGTTLAMVGLDIGDFVDDLMPWLRGRQGGASGQIWRATRGKTTPMQDHVGDIEGLVRPRDGVFNLEVNNLRELIHAAYRRPNGTAGAAHIPNGLTTSASDTAYLRHLVAEKMIIDPRSGRPKLQQGPGRWDWQDARRIAEALVRWNLRARPKPVQVRVGGGSTQRTQYQRRTSIQDRRNQR